MLLWISLLLTLSFNVFSDVIEAPVNLIDFQQNPPSIEWKKIDTKHFELIFPEEITNEAKRVAHILEKAYPFVTRSLKAAPHKIPLVLQNQSTVSNGFVTLAPRRSEWYVTPAIDPELSNTEWLKTLAIHEFRHVVQFQKTRTGFNKYLEIVLGEIGQALGLGLTLPPWFLEGDAVGIETALTRGGRGRLPLFERDLRALLISGQDFDYDKSHMGSFEDYVPNHYVYGYFHTSYLRNKYGDFFLSTLSDYSAQTSYNPLTFYNAVDGLTMNTFENFYQDVMRDLVTEWKKEIELLEPTPHTIQSPKKKHGWTNYDYPQLTPKGDILALKRGMSFINQFVLISGNKEKTLIYPGNFMNEYPFKLRHGRLAFVEWELDPRWGYRDFSRVKVYDLKKDEVVLDLRKTKLRLAVLDHYGRDLLAVEWDVKQGQNIVVINKKGKTIKRLPFDASQVITSIDWLTQDQVVMVVKNREDQKRIVNLSLANGQTQDLLAPSVTNLGFISVSQGQVLVESPQSGIDNIFLVEQGELKQLTSSVFGAYAPVLHGDELFYNDYSAQGMNIVKKNLGWKEEQKSQDSFVPRFEKFAKEEKFSELAQALETVEPIEVKDYSQLDNALNLHSWILLAPPLSNSIVIQGYSRDILNKLSLSAGVNYNINEQTFQGFSSIAWSHLYPVIDFRVAYGGRRQDIFIGGREIENRWEEGTAELGMQIPWKKISGRFTQTFTVRAFTKLIKVTNKLSNDLSDVNDGALHSPGASFEYSSLSRTARRDLAPRWGFILMGHAEEGRDITGVDQKGSLQNLDSRIYLPGFLLHHSFYHQFAYERQRDDFYQYPSFTLYPRGTSSTFLSELSKYSGNYALPLAYPDWHWSRYFYLKRLSLNLFYDALNGRFRSFDYKASSAGWELILDTHFVRIFLPISWGIRGSYVIEGMERDNNYEIFLSSALGVF